MPFKILLSILLQFNLFFLFLVEYLFSTFTIFFFFKLFLFSSSMLFSLLYPCNQWAQTASLLSTFPVCVSKLTDLVSFKTRYFTLCQQCFKNCSCPLYDDFCHQWLYNICIYMHISLFVTKHSLPGCEQISPLTSCQKITQPHFLTNANSFRSCLSYSVTAWVLCFVDKLYWRNTEKWLLLTDLCCSWSLLYNSCHEHS